MRAREHDRVCAPCVPLNKAGRDFTRDCRILGRRAVELRLGQAIPILQQLDSGLEFDLAFIDAQKTEYDAYYELVLPRIRKNGLILFDNMLLGGRLGSGPVTEASGIAIDALNRKLAADPRVESVLLPIADGLQLCRKL